MDRIGREKNLFGQFFWPEATKKDVLEELEKKNEGYAENAIMSIGDYGNTPLHYCAAYGKPSIIQFLIDLGAEINARGDMNMIA